MASGSGAGRAGGAGSGWGQAAWGPDPRGGYGRVGVVPLRPLTVGELLDGAVSAIRFNPRVMIGLSAVVAAISQLIQVLLTYTAVQDLASTGVLGGGQSLGAFDQAQQEALTSAAGGAFARVGVAGLVSALAMLLLTGVLTVVVAEAVLGRHVDAGRAWAQVRPVVWRLVGMTLLVGAAVVAAVALLALLTAAVGAGVLVLALPLLAFFLYAGVRVSLASAAIVLERASVTGALARSWRLVHGAWWRTFGVLVLAAIIAAVVGQIISLPFTLIAGTSPGSAAVTLGPLLVTAVGSIVSATLTWPFTATVTVLLYVDRRMRREGLDLELARAAGLVANPSSPPSPPPPAW